MKVQILSDLHLEHQSYTLKLHNATDVLVLAGDICPPNLVSRLKNMLLRVNRKLPILFIAGNHEYYGGQFDEVNKFWEDFAKVTPNFYFLNNKTLMFGGYQFVGSTLWSNFDLVQSTGLPLDVFMDRLQFDINDFALIRHGDGLFTPEHCRQLNLEARKFIKESVDGFDGKSVILTHFGPHSKSISEKYRDSKLNCYFNCDCSEIFQPKIPLWIHGHTHSAVNYVLGDTHVVCNPRGYPGESNNYNSQLLVELPEIFSQLPTSLAQ